MKISITALTGAAILLSGCAVMPDSLHVGAEHLSSISQHFGNDPTNVGLNAATFAAEWQPTRHTYIEIQDAYVLGGAKFAGKDGVEYFTARAGINIPLK